MQKSKVKFEKSSHAKKSFWWAGRDSNPRRQSQQVYSLLHLTALVPAQAFKV